LSEIKHLFIQILNNTHMKSNKYFFPGLGFAAGILFGFAIIALYSFTSGPASAGGGAIVPISAADAKTYVSNYMSDATAVNDIIKGFTIARGQLDAMNAIAKENPGVAGFRVYLGKDNEARNVGIVIGIDGQGKDALNGKVYNTDAGSLSPCPPVCDVSSPIANQ
jgi:hypothetical protein